MPMLDKTFPTNDCSMCILSPKLVECGRHFNIRTYTNSNVVKVSGEAGNFSVRVKVAPRYVELDKCTGCGACAESCPVKVGDEFDQGLGKRKAIYKQYSQAFPNAFAIDSENCLYLKKGKPLGKDICRKCEKACQAGAINYDMAEEEIEIEVGSIILSPGFKVFDAEGLDYYGYGKLKNVVTSLELERILSASGPFSGHLVRPSDHKEPKRIAFIQCVGSRNCRIEKGYCSAVCCMYAVKEAVIAKEHSPSGLDATIFYMDMRTYGKDFEKYYDRAQNQYGVNFVRSRVYEVTEVEKTDDGSGDLLIRYSTEDGKIETAEFDMVILSVGLEPSQTSKDLSGILGLEANKYGFLQLEKLSGVNTSKEGVFTAGVFSGPRDIPETVMQASAAAAASAALLSESRGTLVTEKEYPPEKDVDGEVIRTGVIVCHCGINISSVVNINEVEEYSKTLPTVVFTTNKLYACAQDAQNAIKDTILEQGLNRVVIASCSPRTHQPLFQETMREAGLNAHLFDMANIRDQCSWVHMNDPAAATAKAKELTAMAVSRAALQKSVQPVFMPMNHAALVIGGGVAGMTSALSLAEQGYKVHLVEKEAVLGGRAVKLSKGLYGEDIPAFLNSLIGKIEKNANITLYLSRQVKDVEGFLGNFVTELDNGVKIEHGIAVLAIGAEEYQPEEYLFGKDERIMTLLTLDEAFSKGAEPVKSAKDYVFIQCVGSRCDERLYCSRICCAKSVKMALRVKEADPSANVFILYRDMRTYGYLEDEYEQARRKGVIFIRFSKDTPPVVEKRNGEIIVSVVDHVLGIPVEIKADVVALAAAVVASGDGAKLSKWFKVPQNKEKFFLEAHMKLRPVDFSTDGVFMAGICHGPKNLEETITQAKAAAGRAGCVLAQDKVRSEGLTAYVITKNCTACGACEAVCPAKAIEIDNVKKIAVVNEGLCKGCGACAAGCRCGAMDIKGCTNKQIAAMLKIV
jgi:heterodisulfide reductase subunit A